MRSRGLTLAVVGLAVLAAFAVAVPGGTVRGHRRPLVAPVVRVRRRRSRARDSAVDRALRYTSYVARGTPRRKLVALTFDDGPGPATPRLLRWLHARRVPATFFLIGAAAARRPALVREEARDGDALGDHTFDHPFLARLGAPAQRLEIDRASALIRRLSGRPVRLFRPPYGSFDQHTLALLQARRMLMVLWTVDTKDYARPGIGRIVDTALSGARGGSILLFHDGGGDRAQTLGALPRIVHRLRLKGYRLVTVPRLLATDPPPRRQPTPRVLSAR